MSYGFKLFTGPSGEIEVNLSSKAPGVGIEVIRPSDSLTHEYSYTSDLFTNIFALGVKKLIPYPTNGLQKNVYWLGAGLRISHGGPLDPKKFTLNSSTDNIDSYIIVMGH